MQLTILQENLKSSLNHLQKAIPSKPQLPILSSIFLEASNDKIVLAATDLYFGIRSTIKASIKEEGKIVIPGDIFKSLILSLSPGEVKFTTKEKSLLIKSNKSKTSLPFQSSEEFPLFPEVSGDEIFFSIELLEKINKLVSFSASTDQTRPILTTLLFDFKPKTLTIVGTDGFRLAVLDVPGDYQEKKLLVPVKAISEVYRIAKQTKIDQVSVKISQELKQLLFLVGDTEIFVRLIEGEFPPYEKIIPTSFSLEINVDGGELLSQVKRAYIFSKESSNIIKFKIDQDKMILESSSPSSGDYQGEINIDNPSNSQNEIAFNVQYVMDYLNTTKPERVWFGMNESLKPAVFKLSEELNYKYIVMPFRVNT